MFVATDVVVFFAFISVCFSRTVVHTIEDLMEKSLIYDYDRHHNRPYYCEFASEKQIHEGNTGTSGNPHVSFKCMDQNPDMIWNIEGEQYFPFYGYSHGKNGQLLRCGDPPKNVTLTNCTAGDFVYSKCQYSCPGDFSNENLGTTECSIIPPMNDIAVGWTGHHCPLILPQANTSGDDPISTVMIVVAAVVGTLLVLGLFAFCIRVRRKPCCGHSVESSPRSSAETSENEEKVQKEDEGGEQEHEREALLQIDVAKQEEGNIQSGAVTLRPEVGIAEFQEPRDNIRNSKVIVDGCNLNVPTGKEPELQEIVKEWDTPIGSLEVLNRPGVEKDAAIDSDGHECTTNVSLLQKQSQKYMDDFALLTEVVEGENNTMMGLAKQLPSVYSIPRGAGVVQSYPKPYTGEEKPALGHLQNMSDHGITIGHLVDYFTGDDIIDHIMSVHIGCGYCTKVAGVKKYKTVKLATKVL